MSHPKLHGKGLDNDVRRNDALRAFKKKTVRKIYGPKK